MNARLLLLEDDPASTAFLLDALRPLGFPVDAAATVAEAAARADGRHALWLLDLNVPDGHAVDLCRTLRARGLAAPAMALTADDSPATAAWLRGHGFAGVLHKPIAAGALRAALAPRLPLPAWDEAAALAALGGQSHGLAGLRALFLADLPSQRDAVSAAFAAGDVAGAKALLHRIRGACGFVGAAALDQAARRLSAEPGDAAAHRDFEGRIDALLATPAGSVPSQARER